LTLPAWAASISGVRRVSGQQKKSWLSNLKLRKGGNKKLLHTILASIHKCARGQEEGNDGVVVGVLGSDGLAHMLAGGNEGRPVVAADEGAGDGAGVDELLDEVDAAERAGDIERGHLCRVLNPRELRRLLQEPRDNVVVLVGAGNVQSGSPRAIDRVQVGLVREQQLCQVKVVVATRNVQRCPRIYYYYFIKWVTVSVDRCQQEVPFVIAFTSAPFCRRRFTTASWLFATA